MARTVDGRKQQGPSVTPRVRSGRAPRMAAGERRAQILEAAVTVFARLGYAGAGTTDIAREAGIGEPTIYRYFANKRELYRAAVERTRDEILEHWQGIAAGAPDPLEAIARIGRWYFEELGRRPELLALRFRSIAESRGDEMAAVVRDGYLDVLRFVERLYGEAQARGQVDRAASAHELAWLFMAVGAVLDVVQLLGLRGEFGESDLIGISRIIRSACTKGDS